MNLIGEFENTINEKITFFCLMIFFCKCYVIKFAVIDITLKEYRGDKKNKK